MPPRTTLAPGAPWPTQREFILRIELIKKQKKPNDYYIKTQPKKPKVKKP